MKGTLMARSASLPTRLLVQLQPYRRVSTEYSAADRWGAQVAQHDLVTALLDAGVVDEVFFVAPDNAAAGDPGATELGRRFGRAVRCGSAHTLPALQTNRQLLFIEPLGTLPQALHLRSLLGVAAPAFGLLYAIPSPVGRGFYYSLQAAMTSRDAVITVSSAGEGALNTIFEQVRCTSTLAAPRLARIPLATTLVDGPALEQRSTRRAWRVPEDAVVLACVGRFSETSKADLEPLVATVRDLAPRARVHLLCAGADAEGYADRVLAYARTCGIGDRITVLRDFPFAAKPQIYACADVFVSIADNTQETFGLALIEAMAAGLPVVASDWSGYRDIVVHGRTGFLVDTRWSEEAAQAVEIDYTVSRTGDLAHQLARATVVSRDALMSYVSTLVLDPSLRRTLGDAGRQRVARCFTWDVVTPQYERLIADSLCRAAPSTPPPGLRITDVFRGYPTGELPRNGAIRLRANAAAQLPLAAALDGDPSGPTTRALLDRLQREGAVSLDSLTAASGPAVVRAAAWLVKRGICTLTPAEIAS
jgi:glycosyltransferase involved in cell wall biosynthesis